MASARSIPGRPSRRSTPRDVDARRELVLVRNEDLEAVGAQRAAHSSMNERSYGVNSGPAK